MYNCLIIKDLYLRRIGQNGMLRAKYFSAGTMRL